MDRDITITELMDDPDCDPNKLLRTYRQFGFVNRMFSNWVKIYKEFISPHLSDRDQKYTLLDVGCGLMDNSRYIQQLAHRDGYSIEITGLDPNPILKHFFEDAIKDNSVQFLSSYLHDIDPTFKYDFIISNHLIHHLSDPQIAELHKEISYRTKKVAIMNDIHRSRLAYIGFSIITLPYKGWTFIQTDGRRSIKRSFKPNELKTLVPKGWVVKVVFPFRLLTVYEAS